MTEEKVQDVTVDFGDYAILDGIEHYFERMPETYWKIADRYLRQRTGTLQVHAAQPGDRNPRWYSPRTAAVMAGSRLS